MTRMPPSARHDKPAAKRVLPADVTVGGNIRALRLRRGVSQVTLAGRLGVTFQQVQKYENGANRIGAGRLAEVAAVLQVPVAALFVGVAAAAHGQALPPITDRQALRAAERLAAIGDAALRRALLRLIERTAEIERGGVAPLAP